MALHITKVAKCRVFDDPLCLFDPKIAGVGVGGELGVLGLVHRASGASLNLSKSAFVVFNVLYFTLVYFSLL